VRLRAVMSGEYVGSTSFAAQMEAMQLAGEIFPDSSPGDGGSGGAGGGAGGAGNEVGTGPPPVPPRTSAPGHWTSQPIHAR
jgi:hypothetical protein